MKKLLILFTILAMITACSPGTTENAESDVLEIGGIFPLTGDGAAYGIPLQQVTDMAVAEINANGGVGGKELKIIYENGECGPKGASTAANKLINVDKVKIILGGLCSGETLGAAPITEAAGVLLFSAASSSPDVSDAGDYVFRNYPSDATSGNKIAQVMFDRGHRTVGILSENTDYAQAITRVFRETFESLGGTVVVNENFNPQDTDFRTQILKIKTEETDAIFIVPQTPATFGLALQQVTQLEVPAELYTNEFAAATDILEQYSQDIEGAYFAEGYFDGENPLAVEMFAKYETQHEKPGGALPLSYYATSYDAVYILKEAIEAVGHDATAIKDYLNALENRPGAAGSLTFDENGDPIAEYVLKQVQNGEVVSLS